MPKSMFEPYVLDVNGCGAQFKFYVGSPSGERNYGQSKRGWPQGDYLRQHIKPGYKILEIGGHHGWTAMVLLDMIGPTGHLITFEPFEKNASIIRKNIEINSIENLILEQKLVGESNRKILALDRIAGVVPDNPLNAHYAVKDSDMRHNRIHSVEMVQLDNYTGFEPDFVKIDVEGYEVKVLEGATEILKSAPLLEIEIHTDILSNYNTTVDDLLSLIDFSQYNCWIRKSGERWPPKPYNGEVIDTRAYFYAVPRSN